MQITRFEKENGENYGRTVSILNTILQKKGDNTYIIQRNNCKQFKNITHEFSFYKSLDYILVSSNPNESEEKRKNRISTAFDNWKHLIDMNVSKANYICNGVISYPNDKIEIQPDKIFSNQLLKYVNTGQCCVAILNAFPLFIYDYFNIDKLFSISTKNIL